MQAKQIVDIDLDPRSQRRIFWRRVLRLGVPILGVALIILAIALIATYSFVTNRRDALGLSSDLIGALDRQVQAEAEAYFRTAEDAVRSFASTVPIEPFSAGGRSRVEAVAVSLLRNHPTYAKVYIGSGAGEFLMVERSTEGSLNTKLVEVGSGERRVTWTRRDETGQVVGTELDPADLYDPRSRPWFKGAVENGGGVYWTDLYIFFSDRVPGITVSREVGQSDAAEAVTKLVVGIDLSLEEVSSFLSRLDVGATGRAMIYEADGTLLAYPDIAAMFVEEEGVLRAARLEELGDPVLTEIYDRSRVEGYGRKVMSIDGTRYIVTTSPLSTLVGRDWTLLLVATAIDFIGFVAENNRNVIIMSLAVVVLAMGLAILLARQGLVADRTARALTRRERALSAQTTAFEELSQSARLFDADDERALGRVTETVSRAVGARRVSLWQFDAEGLALFCKDCFDQEGGGHTSGASLHQSECPALFTALHAGEELEVANAAEDPRTSDLFALYLEPLGCRALLSIPIIGSQQHPVGFLWVEDQAALAENKVDARSFARALAGMIAVRFAASAEADWRAKQTERSAALALETASAAVGPAPRLAMRAATLDQELRSVLLRSRQAEGEQDGKLAARMFPSASVLVIRFLDDVALASQVRDGAEQGEGTTLGEIVGSIREIAERLDLAYVKILNEQIVAVDGLDGDPRQAAAKLAEAALEVQNVCRRSFATLVTEGGYTMGLDSGPVIGSRVGFGDAPYNIWGESVRVATTMATSAAGGTIQVSETAYELLREAYVFRRRGGFYLGPIGEMTTYVLRGRL